MPNVASGQDFGAAKVVVFNGHQNSDTLLWGYLAEQLGRGDVMAPFWRTGAKTPGVDEWVKVLGTDAVLILLDELPSYLQMAQGEPVGSTTLGDLTIGARKRLFDSLPPPGKIDAVAQAYVSTLQKAKRVDTIPTTPESPFENGLARRGWG